MSPHKLFSIVHEHFFERQLHRLSRNEPRLQDFVDATEWVVARDPGAGQQINEYVWAIPIYKPMWMKRDYVVYYTIYEHAVHFIAITIGEGVNL